MKNDLEAIRQRFERSDPDDARWLIDTFIALANEVERLRLDVASAKSRADQAENACRRLREGIDEVNDRTPHPWGSPA